MHVFHCERDGAELFAVAEGNDRKQCRRRKIYSIEQCTAHGSQRADDPA